MFLLRKPSPEQVRNFIIAQQAAPFSYVEVGASRLGAPPSYPLNHYRGLWGSGEESFTRAIGALRQWKMYDLPWTTLCWPDAPITEGTVVAILVRHFGFWSLNACRIVYTIDEQAPTRRYGFAFGTLPEHAETGEERFTVERASDGAVWYELFAFARPKHPLARLGYPLTRLVQRWFALASHQALRAAVLEK